MPEPIRPLDGITVISLEHAIAAPFCTRTPRMDPVPALGQLSEIILAKLGLSNERIQQLRTSGVI